MWSKLKSQLRELTRDPVFTWSWAISVTVTVTTVAIIALFWRRLPPVVPLFYSLPWGEEQLASPLALIAVFCGALGLFVTDAVLAVLASATSSLYSRMLTIGGTVLLCLTTITIIKIILLIT